MNGEQVLAIYETVAQYTRQMLAAARSSEWARLTALEKACSAQIAQLQSSDHAPGDAAYQRRKAALIHGILADDAAIRLLVEPWLATLSQLIGHTQQQARLHRAYGSLE